ncbi:MAG: putative ribonuclease [Actinomycetota bacterium]
MRRGSGPAGQSSAPTPHEWIDTDSGLRDFVSSSVGCGMYSIDTEFHREKTYFPRLALVQIRARGVTVLIDPLSADCRLLEPLFGGPDLAVLHAAQQDLDVLTQSCGIIPARIYDTQLAAGFIGYSTPSLVNLAASLLREHVPKGDRLTDWLRRPLTADQRNYAASDVIHLEAMKEIIDDQLRARGRVDWAAEACEELRTRPVGPTDPWDAWLRVKDIRTVKGRSRWVARHVACWRENRAMDLDIPPRHVLSDIALLGIAQRVPRTLDDLGACRGVDGRLARGSLGETVLDAIDDAVADAENGELHFPSADGDDLDKTMRPAVTLVGVWVAELARQSDLDPALLGTRRDIVELLSSVPGARLATGWRADILGHDVELLVRGRRALTFSADGAAGGLRMVPVDAGD